MDYLIPVSGLILIIVVLMFLVGKIVHQSRELGFAMGSSKRKIREISKRIKEMEEMHPDELTDDDKRKLAFLGGLLKKLSNHKDNLSN
jgi:Sec-independent protein translocase protein TatA